MGGSDLGMALPADHWPSACTCAFISLSHRLCYQTRMHARPPSPPDSLLPLGCLLVLSPPPADWWVSWWLLMSQHVFLSGRKRSNTISSAEKWTMWEAEISALPGPWALGTDPVPSAVLTGPPHGWCGLQCTVRAFLHTIFSCKPSSNQSSIICYIVFLFSPFGLVGFTFVKWTKNPKQNQVSMLVIWSFDKFSH